MSFKKATEYTFYTIKFPNGTHYLGQTTKHEYVRWGQHIDDCRNNKHGNRLIQKQYDNHSSNKLTPSGWVSVCGARDWKFEVIHREVTADKKFVIEMEKRWISKLMNEGRTFLNLKGMPKTSKWG